MLETVEGFDYQIDWNPSKAASNLRKHGISFDAAATVFLDPMARTIADSDHDDLEERWITMGFTGGAVVLVVVHTWQDRSQNSARVRIISARHPTGWELKLYEDNL